MIGSALFGKLDIAAIILAFGGVGGMFLQQKVFAPRPEKLDYSEVRKNSAGRNAKTSSAYRIPSAL